MRSVACIVEGHSEVASLPILLERTNQWLVPGEYVSIARPPIRVARDRFIRKPEEFSRFLLLAAAKVEKGDGVLVLLDADDDCPAELGGELRERAERIVPDRQVSVILANREFEAWLIAGARSIERVDLMSPADLVDPKAESPEAKSIREAKRWLERQTPTNLVDTTAPISGAESVRGAKEWLGKRMSSGYSTRIDQPRLTATVDLAPVAIGSRSFRKLCSDWRRLTALTPDGR